MEWVTDPGNSCEAIDAVKDAFNSTGLVGFSDFLILANNFGKQNQTYADGDLDLNGTVDFADFLLIADNFGKKSE